VKSPLANSKTFLLFKTFREKWSTLFNYCIHDLRIDPKSIYILFGSHLDRQAEIKGFEEFNLENKDKNKDKGKIGNNKVNFHTA